MEVNHFCQDLGVRHKLKYAWGNFSPEIKEDRSRQNLTLIFWCCHGDGLFQVNCPQLAENEGVEEGAHVNDGGL